MFQANFLHLLILFFVIKKTVVHETLKVKADFQNNLPFQENQL
jgi:hypothetical protein